MWDYDTVGVTSSVKGQACQITLSLFVTSKDKATLNYIEPDRVRGASLLTKISP